MQLHFNIKTVFRSLLVGLLLIIGCNKPIEKPLFELLKSTETGIHFSNQLTENDSFNIIQYLYFYNGGGVSIGDINNDNLPDIYFTANQVANRLYLNKGNLQFEDITQKAGVAGHGNWTTGTNMVDINADGWLDIYVCNVGNYKHFKGKNQLFINQKDGTFLEKAAQYGLAQEGFSTQSAFFDYDLDGDLDMYLLNHSVHSTETYQDTSTTRKRDEWAGDKLFKNENGQFVEVTENAGIYNGVAGYGLGIAIGDIDQNGCPDIYIGNDFHEDDFVYLNNCDGTFRERSRHILGHTSQFSMGNDLADFNNDGLLDIATMDMKPEIETILKSSAGIDPFDIYQFKRTFGYHHQLPRNMLQLNQGGQFSEIGQLAGIDATDWSWSVLFADFDNDGWKDLHITNGIVRRPNDLDYLKFIANKEIQENASDLELAAQMPDGKVANYIFQNNGDWTFQNQTKNWGLNRPSISNGGAYSDLDNDGDLDLVINNINEPAFVYENLNQQSENGGSWIKIKVKGSRENPFAIGTKISLYVADQIHFQEINPVRGWQSSVDYNLHFGLGTTATIDSMWVLWPDGVSQRLGPFLVNQTLVFDWEKAKAREESKLLNVEKTTAKTLFNPLPNPNGLNFIHQENRFSDVSRERLIPYLLSTQGPKLAIGDVNGDNLEDVFIGGASKQAGALYIQQINGAFTLKINPDFELDKSSEDIANLLFDADSDGDLDLYVGSGGNEYYQKNEGLNDRLYFNDGLGNFTKNLKALPTLYNQTSIVQPSDFDQDGDIDLFVGSRSISVNYGIPPDSYLLRNDGLGNFENVTQTIAPDLKKVGMITDAIWSDFDKDGDQDLILVGEWMPIKLLANDNGQLEIENSKLEIENSTGLWSSIAAADFDKDGDEDYILGNWGLNSNLQASEKEPLNLYIKDFDKNLSRDAVLTYYQQGKEYPINGLDELASQMVYLKKQYRSYQTFANHTFRQVFPLEQLKGASRQQITNLATSIVKNNGENGFEMTPLPLAVQMAPTNSILIEDFNQDGYFDVLLGGNFFDVQPAIGRMDANHGTVLLGNGDGTFEPISSLVDGLQLKGQVRDLKVLTIKGKKVVLVARNNRDLQMIKW